MTSTGGAGGRTADTLRERILAGSFAPATSLREAALAGELEVSRNTLREALRVLALEGLVVQEPNRGASVRRFTPDEVRDIYVTRRILESQAVEHSCYADDAQLTALESAVVAKEVAEAEERWRDAGTASLHLHQGLVSLLGSRRLDCFFRTLLAQLRLAWGASYSEAEFQAGWAERDRELVSLIRAGERRQARGVLLIYLQDSEQQVLDAFRRSGNHSEQSESIS